MLNRIPQLPYWCVTDLRPAFYDYESSTAITQTAKLYGSMRTFIDDYNKFANEVNIKIQKFIDDVNADQECFKKEIIKLQNDFIEKINMTVDHQNREIQDAISYMKTNLVETIKTLNEMGELDEQILSVFERLNERVTSLENNDENLIYNESTKTLTINNL